MTYNTQVKDIYQNDGEHFQSKMEYTWAWGEKEKDTTQNNVYR